MICNKSKCTGCFMCYNICPKNAIKMQEDENGFIYPKIDKEKCIDCGLCKKNCPALKETVFLEKQKCYAIHTKNVDIREKSTSGGVATMLSRSIIEQGGIVYGVSYVEECSVKHIRVTNMKDLEKLQGSKYVQSYINDTYKQIKQDLRLEKKVLFIGTPCQIAGLKNFLNKEYDNLIVIDIICHGVPSQRYLKDEIKRINSNLEIDRINFRNGNKYGFFLIKNSNVIFGTEREKSPYCDAFMNNLSLRENCYNCNYARPDRISDITLGDFWGLSKNSKFYKEKEKGVSVGIVSTKKGENFLKQCINEFEIEERDYKEAVNGNTQLRHPTLKNKNSDKFRKCYPKKGFEKTYKKCMWLILIKRKIKHLIKCVIGS